MNAEHRAIALIATAAVEELTPAVVERVLRDVLPDMVELAVRRAMDRPAGGVDRDAPVTRQMPVIRKVAPSRRVEG